MQHYMTLIKLCFILVLGLSLFSSCKKDKITYVATPFQPQIPSHFPQMIVPADNPFTVEGVGLGRRLFYDKRLSLDNSISCASCHQLGNAMSDPMTFSQGVNGGIGTRNSMALFNLGYQKFFFWDGRASTLEQQILEPVPNPVEMHLLWKDAIYRLKSDITYRNDFYKAFGEEGIDSLKVSKAIAQFLRTIISGESKFDVMYKVENNLSLTSEQQQIQATVTPEEWAGYDLFKSLNGADCFHCHNGPLMQVQKLSNNGLDATFTDLGHGAISGNPNDNGKFKVPSLRNIALTAPYMHDGRFATLDEVIEHYSSGIHVTPTIDPLIEFAGQGGVQLDSQEKMLLKAFLMTLTDYKFVNNNNYKAP